MKNRILNLIVGCLVFACCAVPESGSGENKSQKEDKYEHIVQKVSFLLYSLFTIHNGSHQT